MQSRAMGITVAIVAIAVAVVLFVVLRDDEGEPTTPEPPPAAEQQERDPAPEGPEAEPQPGDPEEPEEPEIAVIVLRGGEPVGGVQELTFRRGERIEFAVRSDTDEEIHLHGYDVVRNVEAGGRVRFDLEADFDGVFEVELHGAHVPIAEVAVRP